MTNSVHTYEWGFDPMCPCDDCARTRAELHEKHVGSPPYFQPTSWEILSADPRSELARLRVDMARGAERTRYAVRFGGWCINKDLEEEHEPLPSSRDDAFYARCRWDTLEEAVDAAKAFAEKVGLR